MCATVYVHDSLTPRRQSCPHEHCAWIPGKWPTVCAAQRWVWPPAHSSADSGSTRPGYTKSADLHCPDGGLSGPGSSQIRQSRGRGRGRWRLEWLDEHPHAYDGGTDPGHNQRTPEQSGAECGFFGELTILRSSAPSFAHIGEQSTVATLIETDNGTMATPNQTEQRTAR